MAMFAGSPLGSTVEISEIESLADGSIVIGDGSGAPTTLPAFTSSTGNLKLANGGTAASLTDPNADRIMFWDDSAGAVTWLTAGTGLTITDTTMTAGGGQTLYDAIVAPSGGDYTDIDSALVAGKKRIFVQSGTYTVSATITVTASGTSIIGEGWDTIVKANTNLNANIFTINGSLSDIEIKNLKIDGNNANVTSGDCIDVGANTDDVRIENVWFTDCEGFAVDSSSTTSDRIMVRNCYISGTAVQGGLISVKGDFGIVSGNTINGACAASTYMILAYGNNSLVTGNTIYNTSTNSHNIGTTSGSNISVTNNCIYGGARGIDASTTACLAQGNYIEECASEAFRVTGGSHQAIIGNYVYSTGTCDYGVLATADYLNISSNKFYGIDQNGLYLSGVDRSLISGNHFEGSTLTADNSQPVIYLTSSTYNTIVGNHITANSTASDPSYCIMEDGTSDFNTIVGNTCRDADTDQILLSGLSTRAEGNTGETSVSRRVIRRMKNTSGGTINAGEVVILKSAAAGNEVTTTTTQGDDKVYGMAIASISNNAFGEILIEGKTTALKVNGTTDIAIGDFLGTFTSAGIAMKASAGDMVFAMALEAYTTDDSNGVIDALLISPRLI